MQHGLISIILPAYNCETYIKQAIDSVLNQTYSNFELLIADDCSTDGTKKIIDTYTDERIKRFHNEKNLGYLQASNLLFAQCKGDYISFQDADDYSELNRFEILINYLNQNPTVSCVGSNITKVDKYGNFFYESNFPLKHDEINLRFLNYHVVMTGSALLLKKEVIDKIGIYNFYFDRIGAEDTYLYSHILQQFKVENVYEKLYFYRSNPTSVGATHKDKRAEVTHNLVIHFYNQRLNSKPDCIALNQFKKVDACANYLLAIEKTKESKLTACNDFAKAFFKSPLLLGSFIKSFGAHLKNEK